MDVPDDPWSEWCSSDAPVASWKGVEIFGLGYASDCLLSDELNLFKKSRC